MHRVIGRRDVSREVSGSLRTPEIDVLVARYDVRTRYVPLDGIEETLLIERRCYLTQWIEQARCLALFGVVWRCLALSPPALQWNRNALTV